MDRYSILDPSSSPPPAPKAAPANRSVTASVSAGIAQANALKSPETTPRFPAEDNGHSLAEMARLDLDAALQLLAERAQYITGATGTAIALRRGEKNDMLCRASAGTNAPELGALLSMEHGLSGECVRTRQAMRCDDTELDPRVNREVCRELGISSVVVMPVVSESLVLGVFELLSGKPRAFDARDLSALQRLSEMVETAVKHAAAPPPPSSDLVVKPAVPLESPKPETAPKTPLFWSAPAQSPVDPSPAPDSPQSNPVPPVLRNLQKCQACGFPVSRGRTLCVECEEKQWRGQLSPQAATAPSPAKPQASAVVPSFMKDSSSTSAAIPTPAVQPPARTEQPASRELSHPAPPAADVTATLLCEPSTSHPPDLFSNSTAHSESWFAANKYVLGALLVAAIVIVVLAWLR